MLIDSFLFVKSIHWKYFQIKYPVAGAAESTKVNLNGQIMNGVELLHFERGIKYNPLISKNLKSYINKFDIIHIHLRYNLKYYSFLLC